MDNIEAHWNEPIEFQFHNGSIKRTLAEERITIEVKFQFHNGSIKSLWSRRSQDSRTVFQFHNGSIKSYQLFSLRQEFIEFQFHNGSIKSNADAWSVEPADGFNSTMVRLKAGHVQGGFDVGNVFQFHNGSIKSTMYSTHTAQQIAVSIPQWFD